MADHVGSAAHATHFVARERELAQLAGFLERALDGQRQVAFVTGEAGAGKTALLAEFARRAQAEHADLLVASGDCNAQTGIGDPYLPFREVLALLTGDVEHKLAQGAITPENAGRLQNFLRFSGQALVEYGPDLIDIFVPGGALATRVAGRLAHRTGWAERLEELTQPKAPGAAGQAPGLDQSHIFEQYTNVLEALAAQQPLILVIDDLQWADTASIALLFHLSRRLADSRILLLGAYRPDEVALGREGAGAGQLERHPLEKVLTELKRYFGDVVVDLSQAEGAEGRRFVDAVLDSEPNRLGETFRRALHAHTGGHPLFTVELLRHLQERGDLVTDEAGCWVESGELDWTALPARVEGVIEERIGRLAAELREALTVASVEGEDFTAQVVARVQALNERELVRRLTQELDRQHRLVQEQGIERVDGQRLSLYRFRHNLFQRYLYNHLGETEREFLHEDVGTVLEELHGAEAHEIAVQLAEHFLRAGLNERALPYLIEAGDAAARRYASVEAIAHYTRALGIVRAASHQTTSHQTASADAEQLRHLYSRRGRELELSSRYAEALANYEEMATLARERGDRELRLAALTALATLRSTPNPELDSGQAEATLAEAVALARELGDREAEARLLWNLMLIPLFGGGDLRQAIRHGEQALALARELGLQELTAFAVSDLSLPYWATGALEQAKAAADEAAEMWRDLGNLPLLNDALSRAGIFEYCSGHYDRAIALLTEAFEISQSSNSLWGQANCRLTLGNMYVDRGEPDTGMRIMESAIRAGDESGNISISAGTRAQLAWTYGTLGDVERGLEVARLARDIAAARFPMFYPWSTAVLARLHLLNGDRAAAQAALEDGSPELIPEPAMPFVRIGVLLADGDFRLATEDYAGASAVMTDLLDYLAPRAPGLAPDALYIKARALLGLGDAAAARELLLTARDAAEAMGARHMLWPILGALADIEAQQGDAAAAANLRTQAREIVDYIAAHAPTPELRASFLARPEVRDALRHT